MLILPGDITEPIRIMGFDPGSVTTGVSVGEISLKPYHVRIVHTATIRVGRITRVQYELDETIKYNRLHALKLVAMKFIETWKPSHVVAESPYLRDHPQTYATLTECCLCLRQAAMELDMGIDFDLIDPSSAKNAVGAGGRAKKEEVRAAIQAGLPHLTMEFPLRKMSEHAVDATAVLYGRFLQLTGLPA